MKIKEINIEGENIIIDFAGAPFWKYYVLQLVFMIFYRKRLVDYIETEDGHMPLVKKKNKQTEEEMYMPTSEEEFQADLASDDARYLQYCREQEEMYNDPVMNWSGLR